MKIKDWYHLKKGPNKQTKPNQTLEWKDVVVQPNKSYTNIVESNQTCF